MKTHDVDGGPTLERRSVLAGGAGLLAGAAAAALGGCAGHRGTTTGEVVRPGLTTDRPRRVLRFAHMTDAHVMPERKGLEGVVNAYRAVNSMADRPALVITGGDSCHLGMSRTREHMDWMSTNMRSVWRNENGIPLRHCVGNHDIWGWTKDRSGASGSEADFGKQYALNTFGMPATYYAFEQAGWKFIILDSITPRPGDPGSYIGRLDPFEGEQVQFEWLRAELGRTPSTQPVVLVSHIPILSAGTLICDGTWPDKEPSGNLPGILMGSGSMHVDAFRIVALLARHPNVKLCLSGHIHIQDRVEYAGCTYMCGGAVSGAWWREPVWESGQRSERQRRAVVERGLPEDMAPERLPRSSPGFTVVDLFADGSFAATYQRFAFEPEAVG